MTEGIPQVPECVLYVALMVNEDEGVPFARLTLRGDRFSGARLPVDALIEIERYGKMLFEAAKLAWLREDGNELPLPPEFAEQFDLAIQDVREGSATSLLDVPASQFDRFYELGRDDLERSLSGVSRIDFDLPDQVSVDSAFSDIARAFDINSDAATWHPLASLDAFQSFGSSLRPEESLVITAGPNSPAVEVTSVTAAAVFRPFADIVDEAVNPPPTPVVKEKYVSTVAGRLFAMNADKKNFDIETLHYGNIHGNYADADMTADLKAVLESRMQAPVVRITGRMSWRDGALYRILGVDSLELLEIETERWSSRVRELAYLPPNWHPDFEKSEVISFVAIDAAREAMRSVSDLEPRAGMYPREDGGVVVEWPSADRAVSLEIGPEGSLYLFTLDMQEGAAVETEPGDLAELKALLREALT